MQDKYSRPFTFLDVAEVGLESGERLYRVHTINPCDEIYIVRPASSRLPHYSDEEFYEHVRMGLRRKYGRIGWYMLDHLEDVTELYAEV